MRVQPRVSAVWFHPADLFEPRGFEAGHLLNDVVEDWANDRGLLDSDTLLDELYCYASPRRTLMKTYRSLIAPKISPQVRVEYDTGLNPLRAYTPHSPGVPAVEAPKGLAPVEIRIRAPKIWDLLDATFPVRSSRWVRLFARLQAQPSIDFTTDGEWRALCDQLVELSDAVVEGFFGLVGDLGPDRAIESARLLLA